MSKAKETTIQVPVGGHLFGKDIPTKAGKYRVTLTKGQTAWHPGTTKYNFGGPGTIVYTIYSDGGCSVEFDKCIQIPI